MTLFLVPNQSQVQTALAAFLATILPGVETIETEDNRVPEPSSTTFIILSCTRRPRLSTNVDTLLGADFVGSINGDILTVSSVADGSLVVGDTLFGTSIVDNTQIIALGTGTGGAGTYVLNNTQTIASEAMASGSIELLQPTQVDFQLDVHGPDIRSSSDIASIIATAFRDDVAVEGFAGSGYDISPLYADDPMQMPFVNENQQVESRWIVEVHLQVNQTLSGFPQQTANTVGGITAVSVETAYP